MTSHRKSAATMLFTLGLAGLTPVQQSATLVAVGATAVWASPVMAVAGIPGVGLVIKKKPGNCCAIIAPSDANGETRLSGLEPGDYSVRVIDSDRQTMMRVPRDGRLSFAVQSSAGGNPTGGDPGAGRAMANGQLVATPLLRGGGVFVALLAQLASADVNVSGLEDFAKNASPTPEAARIIVAERSKSGPYKDMIDFAQRVCPQTAVNFEDSSIKFGEQTMVVKRGSDPKNPGFKCARGTGEFELFGKKHNYVGHVTLLR